MELLKSLIDKNGCDKSLLFNFASGNQIKLLVYTITYLYPDICEFSQQINLTSDIYVKYSNDLTIYNGEDFKNNPLSFKNATRIVIAKDVEIGAFADNDFKNGSSTISEIIFTEDVKEIKDCAFIRCYNLKSVYGQNIETIGVAAFEDCKNLKTLILPNVKLIKENAFNGCSSLSCVRLGDCVDENNDDSLTTNNHLIPTVIPPNVIVENFVFANCNSIYLTQNNAMLSFISDKHLEIPNGITKIREGALSEMDFEDIKFSDDIVEIDENAFRDCKCLTSITFPNKLTKLGDSALMGCSNLKSISLPSTLTELSNGVFSECRGLIEIKQFSDEEFKQFSDEETNKESKQELQTQQPNQQTTQEILHPSTTIASNSSSSNNRFNKLTTS